MSERIVFIERREDVKKALSFVEGEQDYRMIALSANVMWELDKLGQPYQIPYDYYSIKTLRRLNENLYGRTEDICNHLDKFLPQNIEYFKRNQLVPAHALFHPIKAALNTLCHRLINMKRILEKEDPSEIIFFHNTNAVGRTYRFFSSFTKIHLQLLKLITKQLEIELKIVCHGKYLKFSRENIERTVYNFLRKGYSASRVIKVRPMLSKRSAFDGGKKWSISENHNPLSFMILKNSYSISKLRRYVQENRLGKVVDLNEHYFSISPEDLANLKQEITSVWKKLGSDEQFVNLFRFEDICLFYDFETVFLDIVQKGLTDVIFVHQKTREVLDKEEVIALLLPTISYPDEWGCAEACRERIIPIAVWQHGSYSMFDPHTQPVYFDIKNADYFLCFGDGVRQAYGREAKKYNTEIVPVGSSSLDQVEFDQKGNSSGGTKRDSTFKKVLMPLRGIDVSYLGDSYQVYPPDIYWQEITKILIVFAKFPQIEFVLKLYPHNSFHDNPLYNFVKTNKIRNITLRKWPHFVHFLKKCDLVIIDWPYTTLLESAKTSLPIICYKKFWPLRLGVEELIRRRCFISEDVEALHELLKKYLHGKLPLLENDELLCQYGNVANDGKSCQRAMDFLKNISS